MRLPAWLGRLLFVGSFLAHIHCEDVFGIVGENFTFPVKIDQKITEIIWTKNKDKVAEWEGQNKTTYFTSLRNRGLLNKENGCLTIFNLENSDAGTYVLDYFDLVKKNYVLTFILSVLAPPSEPEINCNISGDDLVLKCTADFQEPLSYTWKFKSISVTRQTQEVFIPMKDVGASEKAACFIKFSQTEKSSEISLTQCFPDKKGDSYHKRSRGGLIAAFLLFIIVVGILGFLYRRGRTAPGTGRAAQENSPAHGSGECQLLCSVDSQQQPNSDRATSSQAVDYENEKPEAGKELNKEDSALKDKRIVNNGVNGVNQEEVTQDAEGGNKEHLSNSHSCSK
ncbi:lymphocyte function-associated antigen 3 isoform X1 [Aptenodytes patagonicus]|uniref:lymphocyte function-associated antigen 3 isoform X1 n=1 Tax=Aptenodytes patagonicus TaxID=9234 RepID=UPI003FA1301E